MMRLAILLTFAMLSFPLFPVLHSAENQLRLGDICRLKGQEENTLQGLGIVVGLKGTGDDASKPTTRALARTMQLLGAQIGSDANGQPVFSEVEKMSNVAMVIVTVTVPGQGVQQGDKLDCTINALGAKSLEGGTLLLTPLLGPRPDRPVVYGLAQGKLTIPDARIPTSASLYRGCKMEATITNKFVANDKVTLVLDKDVSRFNSAQYVEDLINQLNNTGLSSGPNGPPNQSSYQSLAKAIDPVHIEVSIPSFYRDRPVAFVSLLLDTPLPNMPTAKRVVINQREGVIIIGEDVLMEPAAITHKNLSIQAKAGQSGFVGFDPANPQPRPKLKNLVDALNSLNVPAEDVISIIKALKQKGDLYGEVIIQ